MRTKGLFWPRSNLPSPVIEHDGLANRPWSVADRGALEAGEDFGAELGMERAFEHGSI